MFLPCFQEAFEHVPLRGTERVLDVACGPAAAARWLAKRGHRVEAIDESAPIVRHLRERARAQGLPLVAREMKPERLEFPEHSFELALSMFGLTRTNNPELTLWEIARVVQPGGYFLVSFWAKPEESPLSDATTNALNAMFPGRRHAPATRLLLADPRRMESVLLSAGFAQVLARRSRISLAVDDVEDFWARLSEADPRVWLARVEVGDTLWKAAAPRAHRELSARIGALPGSIEAEAWLLVATKAPA